MGIVTIHKSGVIPFGRGGIMKGLSTSKTLIAGVCALFAFLPMTSEAQFGPMGGMGGMGGGPYSMGFSGYGPGAMGGMDGGPGAYVTVKYGEKVYDAVFGDLIEARISYFQVATDNIGSNYYDDGTHGDEIPFDGMPSNIIINRDTYLGPFAIQYKNILQKAYKAVLDMGALQFYNLNVATKDADSKVTQLGDWERVMDDFLNDKIVSRLDQFEGYDDETYVKSIDPSLFESLEGYGGMSTGSFGPGSMFPDLPPPPGMRNPNDAFGASSSEGTEPDQAGGSFNPIERAQNAAGAASGFDPTGSLQATEAMNALN